VRVLAYAISGASVIVEIMTHCQRERHTCGPSVRARAGNVHMIRDSVVVLGGGGLSGAAWMTGIVIGLVQHGIDPGSDSIAPERSR
jgi:hypothetical protein